MGYSVSTWETDFYIPADRTAAALAAVNADPALQRPCWDRAHHWPNHESVTVAEHDCQRAKPFESLTEAVEELTGFHDCEEDDGFRLGYHLDKWLSASEDLLHVLGQYADEDSYVRLMGEDSELFGYRVVDGKLRDENATVAWSVSPARVRVETR